ncbi:MULTISPECIES: transglycosylase domain-containing protein [unclassified Brevibacterium]|uniref:transglycosylase domain-containing protein n=1 Tax=unclassified Brevibacterium TaxID=2614124 RepID=UPI000C49F599|nr:MULTISPECIES: transglycosylase domain-containing protein [unclassified Brevibacterium]SMX77667.1 Membrane carboxypeptidase (penicillin-binding protein) [Brevibacterium sp. 239c]
MVSPESNPNPTKAGAFLQFVAVSAVAGIVAAGLAIPGVGVATASANSAVEIFNSLPATLEVEDLGEKSTMLASDGSEIAEFYWQNRVEVPLDKISKNMQNATIAVEDYRYFEHGGVDIEGIARAAVHNMVSSTTQGGSTLTQQYVKNVLAENAHAKENKEGVSAAKESEGTAGYARKLREAKLAVAVEKKYEKKDILNRYMNINNYSGSPNAYGVQAAAHKYWGIDAKDLNIQQSAMLAGIVQNPSAFNPQRFPDQVLKRRNTVLGQMLKYKHITQKEYDKAVKTDLDLDIHKTPNGCSAAKNNAAFFCDYVENVIKNDDTFGKTVEERLAFLQRGGLTIKTSLNPDIQKIADKQIKSRVPVGDPSGAGHALVTIEPGTGEVIAMAENREYTVGDVKKKDKNKKTSINYTVDRKHNGGGGFQVGSTWKPFVLATWLKSGKGLNTTVNATKRNFPASSWKYDGCPNMGGDWDPNNAGDGEGKGSMTALEATKHSVNTGYAAMGNQLNMCKIMDTAMDLGIRYGSGEKLDFKNKQGFIQALSPSSILGTTETTPIAMAAAFAAFANEGEFCGPKPITSIKDRNGKSIDVPGEGCKRVLDKEVAKGVAYALTQTFNGGTTSQLKIGVPAGAKTGTTNFDVGHTWLLGFTKTLSTAVWTGDPVGTRDWRTNGQGAVRGFVYGATISGKTWQAYMSQAVKETKGNTGFPKPSGKYMGGGGSGGGGGTGGGGTGSQNGGGGNGGGGTGGGGGGSNNGGGGTGGGGDGGNGGGGGDEDEAPGLGGN